jgi:hypothetical protein
MSGEDWVEVAKRTESVERPVSRSAVKAAPTEWNPDYSYVRADLRRIAILASSFILLLVVLYIVD